jgi:hypothetical protein
MLMRDQHAHELTRTDSSPLEETSESASRDAGVHEHRLALVSNQIRIA